MKIKIRNFSNKKSKFNSGDLCLHNGYLVKIIEDISDLDFYVKIEKIKLHMLNLGIADWIIEQFVIDYENYNFYLTIRELDNYCDCILERSLVKYEN